VTLSVTAEHKAVILLCASQDLYGSACYWILLGEMAGLGGRCGIRRCSTGVLATTQCSREVYTSNVSINIKCELICAGVAVSAPGGYGKKCCSLCLVTTLINGHIN
jgi:hypothetical protein